MTTPQASSPANAVDHYSYPSFCVVGLFLICPQPINVTEGLPFTQVIANFTTAHVNPQASQFLAEVNWGDGSGGQATVVANPDGSFNVIASHTFAEAGCCENVSPVLITVQDQGEPGDPTLSAQVLPDIADAPLTAQGVPVDAVPNTPFQATVPTFTDADPGGTVSDYTATIDWGDGSPIDQGTITAQGAGFAVSGSHTYTTSGPFTITIQITDAGGATVTATTEAGPPGP